MNKTYGQIAYEAYCEHRDWKSIVGDQLPSFGEMRKKQPLIAEAWEKAGNAVAEQIRIETGRG